jgi:hypothetical protein
MNLFTEQAATDRDSERRTEIFFARHSIEHETPLFSISVPDCRIWNPIDSETS